MTELSLKAAQGLGIGPRKNTGSPGSGNPPPVGEAWSDSTFWTDNTGWVDGS
jgi:hypothetical protein